MDWREGGRESHRTFRHSPESAYYYGDVDLIFNAIEETPEEDYVAEWHIPDDDGGAMHMEGLKFVWRSGGGYEAFDYSGPISATRATVLSYYRHNVYPRVRRDR